MIRSKEAAEQAVQIFQPKLMFRCTSGQMEKMPVIEAPLIKCTDNGLSYPPFSHKEFSFFGGE